MNFQQDSPVEVLDRRDSPSGSWHCATIVSGNETHYYVKFVNDNGGTTVQKVPKGAVRPCPPPMDSGENWMPGDLVEVYDFNYWKGGVVMEPLFGTNYVIVRIFGTSEQIQVHYCNIRVRQAWQDNEWHRIGKDAGNWEAGQDVDCSMAKAWKLKCPRPQLPDSSGKISIGYCRSGVKDTSKASPASKSKKRKAESSTLSMVSGPCRRLIKEVGTFRGPVSGGSSPFLEKVDAVAYPQNMLGEKCMHASFRERKFGYNEADVGGEMRNSCIGYPFARCIESSEAYREDFLVASCSNDSCDYQNIPYPYHSRTSPSQDMGSPFGLDVSLEHGRECTFGAKEELTNVIHELELRAYRSIMEALYASGPLTWEHEALMTTLRLNLHISIDEHLAELRHLASSH
ncbi:hypothetical protein AMTRI_Chr05g70900 [Amborella trichopoda]